MVGGGGALENDESRSIGERGGRWGFRNSHEVSSAFKRLGKESHNGKEGGGCVPH